MVSVDGTFSHIPLEEYIGWFEDREKQSTIHDVSSPAFRSKFKPLPGKKTNFGFSLSRYWFRFEVENKSETEIRLFLKIDFPVLNRVTLFIPEEDTFRKVLSGSMVHYKNRPYDNEHIIFPLMQKPGRKVYYFHVESKESAVFVPTSLWAENPLLKSITFETGVNGVFYGILAVMFVFNIVILLTVREKVYLYYNIFIISSAIVTANFDGLGKRFLWHDSPFLTKTFVVVFLLCIVVNFFSKVFLNSRKTLPVMNRIMTGTAWFILLLALLCVVLPAGNPYFVVTGAMVTAVVFMSAGIILLCKKDRLALFYVLSWTFFLLTGFIRSLMATGMIPFFDFKEVVLKSGISFQIVTFAIALADRIILLRKELIVRYKEVDEARKKLYDKNLELESANEELQATSEEFEAQNEELISSQMDLAKSEELFRKIFETSPYAIVLNSAVDGRYIMVNDAFSRETGYSREEVIGRHFDEIGTLFSVESEELIRKEIFEKGKVENYTAKGKKKNGEEYHSIYSAVMTEFEAAPAILSLSIDITEKVKLEEQLQQTQKMDVVGQLAGGIAHDFNNMLAGILGSADLLAPRCRDDSKSEKYISTIKESANRAGSLVKKLLVFSRNQPTEKKMTDIHSALIEAMSLLEGSIDRNIELKSNWKAERSVVLGDHTLLQNAFLNIGINARDAMPHGGELSFLTENVSLDRDSCRRFPYMVKPGDFVKIDIADTGCGIPEEIQDRIFDPFFSTKETGKGTGLGLAMVYGTILDHEGGIVIESAQDAGTVFSIYIPLTDSQLYNENVTNDKPERGEGVILVIDDEKVVRETLDAMLSAIGYTVITAEDGEKGLDIYEARKEEISLVVLDQVMPKLSGAETLKKLQKIDAGVLVLFSSGYNEERYSSEFENAGIKGFLQKPYELLSLSRHVADILKGDE